jgi:hypothetical protein
LKIKGVLATKLAGLLITIPLEMEGVMAPAVLALMTLKIPLEMEGVMATRLGGMLLTIPSEMKAVLASSNIPTIIRHLNFFNIGCISFRENRNVKKEEFKRMKKIIFVVSYKPLFVGYNLQRRNHSIKRATKEQKQSYRYNPSSLLYRGAIEILTFFLFYLTFIKKEHYEYGIVY